MIEIRNRVAFLTGAAQGLGRAIARELAGAQMRLALFDKQEAPLRTLVDDLRNKGTDAEAFVVDLSDSAATAHVVGEALAQYPMPRVLIHNAAVLVEKPFAQITFSEWRREVDTTLAAAFLCSKAVWPDMVAQHSGSIVFVSSGSALRGFIRESAYTPAKHGQEGLMKVLALEGEESNIAVNTITTGAPIDTPMSASHYTAAMRVGMVDPTALAPAFRFLAAIDGAFATGQRFNAFQLSEAMRFAAQLPTYR